MIDTPMEESLDSPLRAVLEHLQHRIMSQSRYHGVRTLKSPLDMWIYNEVLFDMRPDVVLEIGNRFGGSALAFAHQLDLLGDGRLIAVDIDHGPVHETARAHPRITWIENDAVSAAPEVEDLIRPSDRVLVVEDSSHTYANTLAVLRTYSHLVRPGDLLIVEDTICRHGLEVGPDPGPFEAIETFVAENEDFLVDRSMESFLITWNPKGFLRRKG